MIKKVKQGTGSHISAQVLCLKSWHLSSSLFQGLAIISYFLPPRFYFRARHVGILPLILELGRSRQDRSLWVQGESCSTRTNFQISQGHIVRSCLKTFFFSNVFWIVCVCMWVQVLTETGRGHQSWNYRWIWPSWNGTIKLPCLLLLVAVIKHRGRRRLKFILICRSRMRVHNSGEGITTGVLSRKLRDHIYTAQSPPVVMYFFQQGCKS